jgi:hypothetical protein
MLLFLLTNVFAKDLDNRIGVGVNQTLGTVPTVSVRYGVPMPQKVMEVQAEVFVGFDTAPVTQVNPIFNIGIKGSYGIIVEDNLNVLAGGAIAYVNKDGDPTFRMLPSLEAQFFLMGLDNLSLGTTIGLNIDLGQTGAQIQFGGNLLGSVHYWF